MTPDLIAYLSAPGDVRERRTRIADYLTNEGYTLPSSPPDADYDEAGAIHWVRGQEMTVAYSVVDQGGRRVYHYVEWEVDHIMLQRIRRNDEWALEYLDQIPRILKRGMVWEIKYDKVTYHSRRIYAGFGHYCVLRVIIQRSHSEMWHVATFYPWYTK
ncbi:MAG: hypothetical protein KKC18_08595 [Chloroflexi bacterium]|nr:hypothetical protein [Chloroflexota bacterium]